MKNNVIKGLVLILALSIYFNVSQIFEIKTLNDNLTLLQENIEDLEELINNQEDDVVDSCSKLYEVTIRVISEDDDIDTSYTHCTNKAFLGDAIDEVKDDLQVFYDPAYSRDYIYGRMIVSFYSLTKDFEEYYQITENGVYATTGVDFVQLVDGSTYEFTLVRWG